MTKRFYTMDAMENGTAEIYIFGEITSWPCADGDVSADGFAQDIAALGDVTDITCHISSPGGEVLDGLAIYNALLSNPAHVTTICEGQACSMASVIFMAGDDRIMRNASALFVHDCWADVCGDSDDLRKAADDLDAEMVACKSAYMRGGIDEATLDSLLKADTWVTPDAAIGYGFATAIATEEAQQSAAASGRDAIYSRIFASQHGTTTRCVTRCEYDAETLTQAVTALVDQCAALTEQVAALRSSIDDGEPDEPDEPDEPQGPDAPDMPDGPQEESKTPKMRLAAAINRK